MDFCLVSLRYMCVPEFGICFMLYRVDLIALLLFLLVLTTYLFHLLQRRYTMAGQDWDSSLLSRFQLGSRIDKFLIKRRAVTFDSITTLRMVKNEKDLKDKRILRWKKSPMKEFSDAKGPSMKEVSGKKVFDEKGLLWKRFLMKSGLQGMGSMEKEVSGEKGSPMKRGLGWKRFPMSSGLIWKRSFCERSSIKRGLWWKRSLMKKGLQW